MTPETIKCLCELDIGTQIKPGESIPDWFVRLLDITCNITQPLNISSEILTIFAKDSKWCIRYWVACHNNTSKEILIKLAGDSDRNIRKHIALHCNTPIESLAILAEDVNETISSIA